MRGQRLLAASTSLLLVFSLALPAMAADQDRDGLRDGWERKYGLDPDRRDTDRDGVVDSAEDTDGDGLGNLGEQRFGTNPRKRDTDGDGRIDSREDANRNGITNGQEQDRRRVPANLRPSLSVEDLPPLRSKCQAWSRQAAPKVCKFGPRGAKRIVLIGDSHAMMWSSPVKRIAQNKGWRFVVMAKMACPALLGVLPRGRYEVDGGVACRKWQRTVIDRLKAHPPSLVIIASSGNYPLVDSNGRAYSASQRRAVWREGVIRTVAALSKRSEVLILGPVPRNSVDPRLCLLRNRRDMSKCVTPRATARGSSTEGALRSGAAASGAHFRTLSGKICSYDPCPVVQGNKLVWRDKGHITDTFARQLQRSVKGAIESAMR